MTGEVEWGINRAIGGEDSDLSCGLRNNSFLGPLIIISLFSVAPRDSIEVKGVSDWLAG